LKGPEIGYSFIVGRNTLLRLTTSKKLLLDVVVIRGDCGENKSEHAEGGERGQQRIVVTTEATRTAGTGSLRFGCALRVVGYRIHYNSYGLPCDCVRNQTRDECLIASGGVALPNGLETLFGGAIRGIVDLLTCEVKEKIMLFGG
jgi:hypothetical protein